MKLSHKITLAAIAAILTYQLLIPPIVGLADQGDYARLLGPLHLGPTVKKFEERYYGYLNRTYTHDTTFRIPGWEGFTTQYVFVVSAIGLNKWISKDGNFDIRVLALVEILAFLAACYFLLRATGRLLPGRTQLLICAALILIFCDVGYVCYFNSFFYEPASYLFLMGLVAVWLDIIANERRGARNIALFGLMALLFVGAKPQNFVAGVLLAAYMWRFRTLMGPPRWMAPLWSAIILAASIAMYVFMPNPVRLSPVYDMVFMTILPQSPDPAAELRSLGLDPKYAKYSGTAAFSPNTAFWYLDFQKELDKNVNHVKIVWYYARHPSRFMYYLRGILPRTTSLRAEFSGNFEKASGYPAGSRSRAFAVWSRFRDKWLSRWSSGLLISLMLSVPVSFWIALRPQTLQARLLAECYCVLSLLTVATFFTTILGDALDLVKHLYIYNALTDICLVFAIAACVQWIASKRRRARLAFHHLDRDRREAAQSNL